MEKQLLMLSFYKQHHEQILSSHSCVKMTRTVNLALRLNFPDLYKQGYRIGFYREVPQRQEDVAPKDRLKNR